MDCVKACKIIVDGHRRSVDDSGWLCKRPLRIYIVMTIEDNTVKIVRMTNYKQYMYLKNIIFYDSFKILFLFKNANLTNKKFSAQNS